MTDDINNENDEKNIESSLDQEQSSVHKLNSLENGAFEPSSLKRCSISAPSMHYNSDERIKITQLVNAATGNHIVTPSSDHLNKNSDSQLKLAKNKVVILPNIISNERNTYLNLSPDENGRLLPMGKLSQYQNTNYGQSFSPGFKHRGSLPTGSLIPTRTIQKVQINTANTNPTNQLTTSKHSNASSTSINKHDENSSAPLAKAAHIVSNTEFSTSQPATEITESDAVKTTIKHKTPVDGGDDDDIDGKLTSEIKKPRKKRRVYSCKECRKMKTRCDFQPLIAKCHRCVILGISCSLGEERKEDVKQALEAVNKTGGINNVFEQKTKINSQEKSEFSIQNVSNSNMQLSIEAHENRENLLNLQNKVSFLVNKMDNIENKLDMMINHLLSQSQNTNTTPANIENYKKISGIDSSPEPLKLSNHGVTVANPPFRLLDQIERELFGIYDDNSNKNLTERELLAKAQRAWVVARQKFMEFFYNHEELCFKLAHAFLKKAHFWIIPGGIKTINREYVEKHPFITSVFAIIAMGFDEYENFSTEQEILYPIVERLLSNTLTMFDQLHDHDVEAILYISMYTISRKSKKFRQVKFDGLILSKFATDSLLNLIDFHKIKENVYNGLFDGNDLFHLRILNSLTTVKMEYSIGYCNFSVQDRQLRDFNDLTVRFPQSTFGDEIKLGEIKLGDIVNKIFLNFDDFYLEILKGYSVSENKSIIEVLDMRSWLETYRELSSKDGSNLLIFTYDFYYIVIFRNILCDFAVKDYEQFLAKKDFFVACLNTVKKYCFAILSAFLKLPTSLIKGAPIITLQQTVYSCLSLCDFLHCFSPQEKAKILNLCTKIYWHLNSIGEKLNEATQNVGIIIKTLIDSSMAHSQTKRGDGADINIKYLFLQIQQGCKHNSIKRKEKQSSNKNKDNHSSITSVSNKHIDSISNPYTPRTTSNAATISNTNTPISEVSINQNNNRAKNNMNQFNFGNGVGYNSLNFPDVEQFQSFEDFFQDFFQNTLKPTSQNMFQGK
ncbi:hypothetical protein QEN19_002983 [Hanseniaspora menglaensis]